MNWKKFLLPGLSGLVVAAVAVVAGKRHKKKQRHHPRRIPDQAAVRIETGERGGVHHGESYRSRVIYDCKPTQFRVWSLLNEPPKDGKAGGSLIYAVSPMVELARRDGVSQSLAEPRFYATIHCRFQDPIKSLPNQLAVGVAVEFHKCHVGGSANGIDTGERIVTAPVTSFSFDAVPE